MTPARTVAAILIVTSTITFAAQAQTYEFFNIVDDSTFSDFNRIDSNPKINDDRRVSFHVRWDSFEETIFTRAPGDAALQVIVDTFSGGITFADRTAINNSGTVAFQGNFSGSKIFTGSGGSLSVIADTSGTFTQFDPRIDMNNSGRVAFIDRFFDGAFWRTALYTSNGSTTTQITDPFGSITGFGSPAINSSGTVAFAAFLDGGQGDRLYKGNGGALTELADASAGFFSSVGSADINDSEQVVFSADLLAGGSGIFLAEADGSISTVADTTDGYSNPGFPSINNLGHIAFISNLSGGGRGIFTGDDPVEDAVIRTGDSLFGSTVTQLFFLDGLNNNGDVAFWYQLANGTKGIAVAQREETILFSVQIVAGEYVSGTLASFFESDNDYGRIRSVFGFLSSEPNVNRVQFAAATSVVSPTTVDVTIESKLNNPGGTATVRAYNFTTGAFETISTYNMTTTDQTVNIPIGSAATYIEPDLGTMGIDAKHIVVATFSLSGFISSYDLVEFTVE